MHIMTSLRRSSRDRGVSEGDVVGPDLLLYEEEQDSNGIDPPHKPQQTVSSWNGHVRYRSSALSPPRPGYHVPVLPSKRVP
jgi:hypothetical protein